MEFLQYNGKIVAEEKATLCDAKYIHIRTKETKFLTEMNSERYGETVSPAGLRLFQVPQATDKTLNGLY